MPAAEEKNFNPKWPCLRLLILASLLSVTASQAFAIKECGGIVSVTDYKIAVDDVSPPPAVAATPAATPSIDRLAAELQTQMKAITVEEGGAIIAIPCAGRRPASEAQFDRPFVEGLNNYNVLLEIWGSFEPSATPAASGTIPQLQFVLVPVRYYEHFLNNLPDLGGVYLISFTSQRAGNALTLFERSSELRACVALSMALKKIKEGHNELALKYLCKAETSLNQRDSRILKLQREALLKYAQGLEGLALSNNRTASLLPEPARANICSAPVR